MHARAAQGARDLPIVPDSSERRVGGRRSGAGGRGGAGGDRGERAVDDFGDLPAVRVAELAEVRPVLTVAGLAEAAADVAVDHTVAVRGLDEGVKWAGGGDISKG